jgi:hypothetical protein
VLHEALGNFVWRGGALEVDLITELPQYQLRGLLVVLGLTFRQR